ncbi:UNVERIFIED_CONTAM: hypothetical protein K2H54_051099 [Gekko kuhli]
MSRGEKTMLTSKDPRVSLTIRQLHAFGYSVSTVTPRDTSLQKCCTRNRDENKILPNSSKHTLLQVLFLPLRSREKSTGGWIPGIIAQSPHYTASSLWNKSENGGGHFPFTESANFCMRNRQCVHQLTTSPNCQCL